MFCENESRAEIIISKCCSNQVPVVNLKIKSCFPFKYRTKHYSFYKIMLDNAENATLTREHRVSHGILLPK